MSKTNDGEFDVNTIEEAADVPDFKPTVDAEGKDTTDWKAQAEANLELAKRNAGIAQRNKTRLQKLKENAQPADKKDDKGNAAPQTSDLGEKAYLMASGIKGADEIDFVQKMKKETGKDIESLLGTTYFQTEFKEFKEKRDTANAVPQASKRSNNSSVDTVEYWIAKGEMPPENQPELRRAVVNARMKKEESKGQFYNS